MRVICTHGSFLAEPIPGHPAALALTAASPDELVALRNALLPDMQVEGIRATVARDEWAHALELLVGRL